MSEWKEPTNAAEELLCSVPSLLTDHPWVREAIVQLRAHAAALERIAELEAENARLKRHAEALYKVYAGEDDARCDNEHCEICPIINNYRAEFKEAKPTLPNPEQWRDHRQCPECHAKVGVACRKPTCPQLQPYKEVK